MWKHVGEKISAVGYTPEFFATFFWGGGCLFIVKFSIKFLKISMGIVNIMDLLFLFLG